MGGHAPYRLNQDLTAHGACDLVLMGFTGVKPGVDAMFAEEVLAWELDSHFLVFSWVTMLLRIVLSTDVAHSRSAFR